MKLEKERLWYRVLVARYGMDGRHLRDMGSRGSCWLRDMERIRDGIGFEGGSWFEVNVFRKVCNGVGICF